MPSSCSDLRMYPSILLVCTNASELQIACASSSLSSINQRRNSRLLGFVSFLLAPELQVAVLSLANRRRNSRSLAFFLMYCTNDAGTPGRLVVPRLTNAGTPGYWTSFLAIAPELQVAASLRINQCTGTPGCTPSIVNAIGTLSPMRSFVAC